MKTSILALALLLSALLGACTTRAPVPAVPAAPSSSAPAGGSAAACTYTATGEGARKIKLPWGAEIALKQGYFDGTSCHRLADSGIFVLQCGDPTGTGTGGPSYQFADELSGEETYPAGTLAMANAGPGTNGSQFFIVFADTTLAPNYSVFGALDAAGLKTALAIAAGGQDGSWGDGTGKPKLPAVITSATAG